MVLENKLGLSIRLLGASLFIVLRLFWMTLLVFLTAKAIAIMIGADEKYIRWIVVITAAFAITYTSLGVFEQWLSPTSCKQSCFTEAPCWS